MSFISRLFVNVWKHVTFSLLLLKLWFSPHRVNVVSLVRGAVPVLRVFRDPVVSQEHLEVMDPRSIITLHHKKSFKHPTGISTTLHWFDQCSLS